MQHIIMIAVLDVAAVVTSEQPSRNQPLIPEHNIRGRHMQRVYLWLQCGNVSLLDLSMLTLEGIDLEY
jgi:hypothetical protein